LPLLHIVPCGLFCHCWEAATRLGGGGAVERRQRGELGGGGASNREGSWLGGIASGDPVRHSQSFSLWALPQIAPNSPNKHLFEDSFLGGLNANNPNLTLMIGYFRAI
jgi:hypothetical protein